MNKSKALKVILTTFLIVTVSAVISGCSKTSEVVVGDKMKVALILDEGGVNDQSFNQSSYEGGLRAMENFNVEVGYLESKQESDYMTNIESAIDSGADMVIGVGFKLTNSIEESAKLYPDTLFAGIDCDFEGSYDNLLSIKFNEQQSGYLVGLIAGEYTKTNNLGFVGGMDIASVTNFLVGFREGVAEVNPDATVLHQFANSFTDAAKGKVIAEQMIKNENCDIVFTAAGGVNTGVYESVRENGVYAIGVDMACNYILPEHIITSALKNVGTSVELVIEDLVSGQFKPGVKTFDILNGGVGYERTNLLSEELINKIELKIDEMKNNPM